MATYSALPANLNLALTVGDDFTLSLTVTENGSPWVATGATLATDIIDSSGAVVATDFTTAASTGSVTLSLTDTNTTTLGVGVYSYRLSVTKSSLTRDWIAGTLSIVEAGVGGSPTSSASLSISNSAVTLGITSLVAPEAAQISVADAGGFYTGDDVEEVLAEIMATPSTTTRRLVELATEAETQAGTSSTLVVTPSALKTRLAIENGRKSGVFAVLGTSISARNQSTNYGNTNNWHGYLSVLSNHRLSRAYAESTGGATLATIRDTNLATVLASASRLFPGSCVIEGGTNDVSDQSTGFSSLTDIVTSLVNAGIRPVLAKIPPRSDGSQNAVLSWNARIAEYAKRNGFPVLDMYTPLLDKSTGATTAAYQLDTVHPNELGHYQIALAATQDTAFMSQWGDARPQPQTSTGDSSNLVTSDAGLFLADSNADGISNSWSQFSGSNATASRNTHDGLTWQRLTKTASQAGNSGLQYTISSGFSVGDVLEMSCYVVSSVTDITWGAVLEYRSSVPATIASAKPDIAPFGNSGSIGAAFSSPTSGYLLRGYYTVPASTATLRLNLDISGTPASGGYVEYAAVTVRNLTTLGLA